MQICYVYHPDNTFDIVMFREGHRPSPTLTYGIRPAKSQFSEFHTPSGCQQTFMALGNAKTSLFLAVLRKIILLVPLIYILPNFFADKAFAVFLAEPVSDLLAVCTTAVMFFFQFRKAMDSIEN